MARSALIALGTNELSQMAAAGDASAVAELQRRANKPNAKKYAGMALAKLGIAVTVNTTAPATVPAQPVATITPAAPAEETEQQIKDRLYAEYMAARNITFTPPTPQVHDAVKHTNTVPATRDELKAALGLPANSRIRTATMREMLADAASKASAPAPTAVREAVAPDVQQDELVTGLNILDTITDKGWERLVLGKGVKQDDGSYTIDDTHPLTGLCVTGETAAEVKNKFWDEIKSRNLFLPTRAQKWVTDDKRSAKGQRKHRTGKPQASLLANLNGLV